MSAVFINSKNAKTSDPYRLVLRLVIVDLINPLHCQILEIIKHMKY